MVRRGAAMRVDVASSGSNIQILVGRDDRSGDDVGGEDGRGWYDEALGVKSAPVCRRLSNSAGAYQTRVAPSLKTIDRVPLNVDGSMNLEKGIL